MSHHKIIEIFNLVFQQKSAKTCRLSNFVIVVRECAFDGVADYEDELCVRYRLCNSIKSFNGLRKFR